MNLLDYMILGVLIIAVTGAAIWLARRKKHRSCCGNCTQNNCRKSQ